MPASELQAPTDINILSHHIRFPALDFFECAFSKRAHDSRNGKNHAVDALGSFDQTDYRRKLPCLNLPYDGGASPDSGVARHTANFGALDKVLHHIVYGVIIENGITINTHDNATRSFCKAMVEGTGFALVGLVQYF